MHRLTSSKALSNTIGCPIDVLELLVETCRRTMVSADVVVTNEVEEEDEEGHREALESKIHEAVRLHGAVTWTDRNTMVSNIHRIACLLYVNRTVHRVTATNFRHTRLVAEGIDLLTKMKTCQNAWALFIIATEAINDEQRLAILNVFEQTRQDRRRRSSHVRSIQHMVEAVWKQHDLNAEEKVDHLTILDAVIGGIANMPVFA